jgi:hypothetical protein
MAQRRMANAKGSWRTGAWRTMRVVGSIHIVSTTVATTSSAAETPIHVRAEGPRPSTGSLEAFAIDG